MPAREDDAGSGGASTPGPRATLPAGRTPDDQAAGRRGCQVAAARSIIALTDMSSSFSSLPEMLAAVNAAIREAALRSAEEEREPQVWEFVCECGTPGCFERVVLSLEEFERFRDGGRPLLAPEHRESQIARARSLLEEASALRAQALHQVRRAAANLARRHPEG